MKFSIQSVAVDEGTKRIIFLMKGGEIQNPKYLLWMWRQKRSSEGSSEAESSIHH